MFSVVIDFVSMLPFLGRNQPPRSRLGRLVPLALTVIGLWLRWRWLRIKRWHYGDEMMRGATHEFHLLAAHTMVNRAIRQQGLIIKTCQFLGSRADILMEEYVETLSLLHDQVPPRPWTQMRPVIERELGGRIEDLYTEFDTEAVAAASLAQVYRARLHDGTSVAVKVQYPGIEEIVTSDLKNIRLLANAWARLETVIDFRPVVTEMESNAPEEVDFVHEGHASEEIAEIFKDRDDVVIPKIYWERSARRVLTMDFIDGMKITDLDALDAAGIDKHQVANTLIDLYNVMILRRGMFHADPHPGNLFVLPPAPTREGESEGPARIGLIDFGLTKHLPNEFREQVIVLTSAIISQHRDEVRRSMEGMGFRTRYEDDETYYALGEAFLGDVLHSGKAYADQALFADVNVRLGRVLRSNPLVQVPGDVILIARVMGLLSGIGRTLDSRTDILEALVPYLEEESAVG